VAFYIPKSSHCHPTSPRHPLDVSKSKVRTLESLPTHHRLAITDYRLPKTKTLFHSITLCFHCVTLWPSKFQSYSTDHQPPTTVTPVTRHLTCHPSPPNPLDVSKSKVRTLESLPTDYLLLITLTSVTRHFPTHDKYILTDTP
jgi:hypothetical protein